MSDEDPPGLDGDSPEERRPGAAPPADPLPSAEGPLAPEAPPADPFAAPPALPGLLLGSLQLCAWLLLRPAAFQAQLRRVAPELSVTFCLTQLTGRQLRNAALLRLLAQGFLVAPALACLPSWGVYAVLDGSAGRGFMTTVGVYEGALQISVLLGALFGAAGGIVGGLLSVWANPLLSWLADPSRQGGLIAGQSGGIAGLIAGIGCFAAGLAAHATLSARDSRRLLPSIAAGLLVGALVIGLLVALHRTLGAAALGITGLSLSAGLVARRRTGGGLLRGAILGAAVAVSLALTTALGELLTPLLAGRGPAPLAAQQGAQATLELLSMSMLLLPALVADFAGGAIAAAVAGAVGGGLGWVAVGVLSAGAPRWPTVPLGAAALTLGLTLPLWRPALLYPLELALGALLQRRAAASEAPPDLRRHPAFWDALQRLPLYGLEDQLVLCWERGADLLPLALRHLGASPQRWAAREAQLEITARSLERCADLPAVAAARRRIGAGVLEGTAGAALRVLARASEDVEAALQQSSPYNRRATLRAVEERLEGLLRDLLASRDGPAGRLLPVAGAWMDRVAAARRALAEEAERRQEIESPYVIALPLGQEQEVFVGRSDVGARIERLLLQPQRPPLLLYGQRRMGKTSLLHNLGRLLPSDLCPLFIDLQGPATRATGTAGFLYNLGRDMAQQARRHRDLELAPPEREALEQDPFTSFERWLDAVAERLGDRRAVLLLDEFEQLDQAFQRGRLQQAEILGMLRHLIQHRPKLRVLLAGSHTLEELRAWAGYLINVQTVHLGCLEDEEARRLIERPASGFALEYDDEATERVLTLTGRHPYLVQLLCDRVVAHKNAGALPARRRATAADVEAAAAEALEHGAFFFADIEHNQLDEPARRLLRALARRGAGARAAEDDCRRALGQDPRPALRQLCLRELLRVEGGGYRFEIELLRRAFAGPPAPAEAAAMAVL